MKTGAGRLHKGGGLAGVKRGGETKVNPQKKRFPMQGKLQRKKVGLRTFNKTKKNRNTRREAPIDWPDWWWGGSV